MDESARRVSPITWRRFLRQTNASKQICPTRITRQGLYQQRLQPQISQLETSILIRFFEPLERLVLVIQAGVHNGQVAGIRGLLGKFLLKFGNYGLGLVSPSRPGMHIPE